MCFVDAGNKSKVEPPNIDFRINKPFAYPAPSSPTDKDWKYKATCPVLVNSPISDENKPKILLVFPEEPFGSSSSPHRIRTWIIEASSEGWPWGLGLVWVGLFFPKHGWCHSWGVQPSAFGLRVKWWRWKRLLQFYLIALYLPINLKWIKRIVSVACQVTQ